MLIAVAAMPARGGVRRGVWPGGRCWVAAIRFCATPAALADPTSEEIAVASLSMHSARVCAAERRAAAAEGPGGHSPGS